MFNILIPNHNWRMFGINSIGWCIGNALLHSFFSSSSTFWGRNTESYLSISCSSSSLRLDLQNYCFLIMMLLWQHFKDFHQHYRNLFSKRLGLYALKDSPPHHLSSLAFPCCYHHHLVQLIIQYIIFLLYEILQYKYQSNMMIIVDVVSSTRSHSSLIVHHHNLFHCDGIGTKCGCNLHGMCSTKFGSMALYHLTYCYQNGNESPFAALRVNSELVHIWNR